MRLTDPFERFVNAFFLACAPNCTFRVAAEVISNSTLALISIQSVTVVPSCTHPSCGSCGVKENARSVIVGLARVDMGGNAMFTGSLQRELAFRRIPDSSRSWFLFHRRRRHKNYQRKCAKAGWPAPFCACPPALLIAGPRPAAASLFLAASELAVGWPRRLSAYCTIHLIAESEICRAGGNFHWHLIGRASNSTRFHFQARSHILQRLV